MRSQSPAISSNISRQRIQGSLDSVPRLLEFDLLRASDTEVHIKGRRDNLQNRSVRFWLAGNVHEAATEGSTDNTVSGLGGNLDGLTAAANTYYLIWAVGDQATGQFAGYGLTRKPLSGWTSISSGAPGALANLGGLTNAYSFQVGARVIVRSTAGGAPNFTWNHGTITAIPSNVEITVQLDTGLTGANTIVNAGTREIEQLDFFHPWDGSTTSHGIYSSSYRLLGECRLDSTADLVWLRKANEHWQQIRIPYPALIAADAVASATYYYWRYLPTWARRLGVENVFQTNKATITLQVQWIIPRVDNLTNEIAINNTVGTAAIDVGYNSVAEISDGSGIINLTQAAGAGTVQNIHTLLSVNDGGLRE